MRAGVIGIERIAGISHTFWNYGSLYEFHIGNMAIKVFILTLSLKRTTNAVHVCIFFKHQNPEKCS